MQLSLSVGFAPFILLSVLTLSAPSHSTELVEIDASVRALGMGNAYSAVVKNSDSLFYNPAGLAKVSGVHWLIMDPYVGVNNLNVYSTIQEFKDSDQFAQAVKDHYGDHIWAGAGGKTAFYMPYFAFSIYDHVDTSLDINNPVYPSLDISVINDLGYAAGTAFPIVPGIMQFGLALRYIQRTGSAVPFGPSYMANLDPATIMDNVQNKGRGYSLNAGLNVSIPGPVSPSFSAVWKDIGVTKFKAAETGDPTPPSQRDEMIVGAALNMSFPLISVAPAIDFKYLNRSDVQLGNKIHFGIELGLPIVDIRAGFNQGYYTAGAGLDLGLIRVDAATYGVELGAYPGQKEDRRYIVQFSMELGFDPSMGLFGGGSGKGGKKGGSGSSSSSWSSGRKLKQRR